jgi:predicted dehydrogenase
MKQTQLVLVGIGGYARLYVEKLLKNDLPGVRIAAVVDPMAEKAPHWPELQRACVPGFDSLPAFLNSGIPADLAVISTPIALHAEQSCALLGAGINVLCEKPMAATVADARKMQAARDASGRFLEIGYQWSFSKAIQSLKSDILAGHFGAPRRFVTCIAWPRTNAYYGRNAWAGCKHDQQGRPVFDSPANNATAHHLHNMLFLLGPTMTRSTVPKVITAECYRANPIDNFDAVCCRIETQETPEVLFFSAHCVDKQADPMFRFEFDDAVVELGESRDIIARFKDGRAKQYGNPDQNQLLKLEVCLAHCHSTTSVVEFCGPEAALAQVQCIAAMQQIQITDFPPQLVQQTAWGENETLTYMPGLADAMRKGFERGRLFSELNLPWIRAATRIELTE